MLTIMASSPLNHQLRPAVLPCNKVGVRYGNISLSVYARTTFKVGVTAKQ